MLLFQNYWQIFLLVLSLSFLSCGVVLVYAKQLGLIDRPVARSSHQKFIPKGGGVVFILVALFFVFYLQKYFWIFPIIVLAIISFFGDRQEISFWYRLFWQILCAALVLVLARDFFFTHLIWYAGFWLFLVASTNFFNFMDGIDGIAVCNGLVSFLTLGLVALNLTKIEIAFFCFLLFFSVLGFLPWNGLLRRKIFMGDVGSVFLGMSIASLILILSQSWIHFFQLCFLLYFFYADTILTLVVKKKRKLKFSEPHRFHFYQLLANEMKIPHWRIAIFYAMAQALGIFFLLNFITDFWNIVFFYSVVSSIVLIIYFLMRKKITNRFF